MSYALVFGYHKELPLVLVYIDWPGVTASMLVKGGIHFSLPIPYAATFTAAWYSFVWPR